MPDEAMPPGAVEISHMTPNSPEIRMNAGWRHDEWIGDYGFTRDETRDQLDAFVKACVADRTGPEAALIAKVDGALAGTCLLVREEIDARHDVTPWLAGLYVAPDARGKGVGRQLVRAIEEHGRRRNVSRLHLYTIGSEGFYARLGWQISERFDHHGERFVLMHIVL